MAQKRYKPKVRDELPVIPRSKRFVLLREWWDWASVWGPIILSLAVIILIYFYASKSRWNSSIDSRLASWKEVYKLTPQTVDRFREMELEFHGTGNPFVGPTPHTPVEVKVHHEQMAELMTEESAIEFRHDLATGRWDH